MGFGAEARITVRNLEPNTQTDRLSLMEINPQPSVPKGFRQINTTELRMNPDNPPWNSGIAFLVWAASVGLVVLVPMLVLIPYILSRMDGQIDQAQIAEMATKDPNAILIQILAILPVHLITLLLGWYVVTNFRRFPFRETLGWNSGGMRWWHHLLILVGFLAVMIFVGSIIPEQENELLRIIKSSRWALYTVAFFAVVTAPLVEELVYRGILYSAFQRSIGTFGAVVLVTLLFALVHVPQYYPSISTILLLTLLSLILTLVRVFTRNLLPCIILHTIFNGIQSAVLIAEPHLNLPPPTIEQAAMIIGV